MIESSGPLSGVTVVDLTRILAGPYCTQILGDLGADVIKIERPGSGDDTRRFGPPFLKNAAGKETGESAYFIGINRNKCSVAIDIAKPEGQAVVRRLIGRAEVVVENFKVGNLARYGLGYDDLKVDFPGLIYCSITGFGQTGPYAERPGYDPLIQAMGGIMSLTGEPEGEPQKLGVPIADIMAGMYACVGIVAALRSREVTGEGQYIDISMLDTQVAWLSIQAMNYLISGEPPKRLGNAHPNIVPYQVFRTTDGYIMVTIGNDAQFETFCRFAGVPGLAAEERFATNGDRVRNREALIAELLPIFAAETSQHWLDGLQRLTIGCGPINTIDEVFADPQVKARDMVREMAHPAAGGKPVPFIADPIRLSGTPVSYRRPPPSIGEHTAEVLREFLELDDAALARLRDAGAI